MAKKIIEGNMEIILSLLIALLISIYAGPLIYCSSFFIHEGGHYFSGLIYKIITGNPNEVNITNYQKCNLGIYVPQQTKTFELPIFAYTGPLAVILVSLLVAFIIDEKSKDINRSALFSIPIILVIHETFGNVIFGTDNHFYGPIFSKPLIWELIIDWIPVALIISATFLLYRPVRKYIGSRILDLKHKHVKKEKIY